MKQGIDYYTKDFQRMGGAYSLGHYAQRNAAFAEMILRHNPGRVIELAAAEGNLAYHLIMKGDIESYIVSDFCPEALSLARAQVGLFECVKFRAWDADRDYPEMLNHNFDTFISTAMEHFENDLAILELLPAGTLVCLSLPNFPCQGHVRYFNSKREIMERYRGVLDFVQIVEMPVNYSVRRILERLRGWLFHNRYNRVIVKITNCLGLYIIGNRKKWNIIAERI